MVRVSGNTGLFAVGEIVDAETHDLPGDLQGSVFVELDVGGAGNTSLWRGGDHLGMVVLGDPNQRLHDALDIDHHGIHHSGHDGQFL